jgi:hypothetical protein
MITSTTDRIFSRLTEKPIYTAIGVFWLISNILGVPLVFQLASISGTSVPDLTPLHNAQTLTEIFSAYGPHGMRIYEDLAFYDSFYPIAYALFFGTTIYFLYRNHLMRHLAWLPVFAALNDFIENHFFGNLAKSFPSIDPAIARFTGIIVTIKLLLVFLSVLLIIGGLARLFIRRNL